MTNIKNKIEDPINDMIRTMLILLLAIVLKDGYAESLTSHGLILLSLPVIVFVYILSIYQDQERAKTKEQLE
ncbi:hypothetical protein [Chryseosolibacter indicus]|uniref:Uncharacterized protein n=1 Tax=Chryseosolibacter indicus TaxID=2782351 RepID=A0ABS5VXL5_9BACT|nr:hypothetical protein [Chryseosolibacter indicus]MBT1705644.1 hypothetical protein [Chryseosolibacter indicus]